MGDTFLLGAGFSKAVCQTMPTMKELFQLLEPLIDTADGFNREAYDYASGNVETLLTYYAIPSPSDDPIEVFRKRRVTALLEQKIGSVLQCRERTLASDASGFKLGEKLVGKWMEERSHVLTTNYDTLVEQLTGLRDDTRISGLYPIPVVPSPAITGHNPYGTNGLGRALTLYKLHGSVSWYKTHGESNSDPIYGYSGFSLGLHSPEKLLGDKRRFIAPPVHDKSTLLSHESMRNLWRRAKSDALAPADSLYVIGYSLPEMDMAMRTLLWEARRPGRGEHPRKIPLYVVDIDGKACQHYHEMLGHYYDVDDTYAGVEDAFDRFVEEYTKDGGAHTMDQSSD
jgi:hypothetical protein